MDAKWETRREVAYLSVVRAHTEINDILGYLVSGDPGKIFQRTGIAFLWDDLGRGHY